MSFALIEITEGPTGPSTTLGFDCRVDRDSVEAAEHKLGFLASDFCRLISSDEVDLESVKTIVCNALALAHMLHPDIFEITY